MTRTSSVGSARPLQLRAPSRELLERLPHIEIGAPVPPASRFVHAIERLPVRV